MEYPSFYCIRQRFDDISLRDVAQAVRDKFANFKPETVIHAGQRVAVGVGSRATHDLKILVETVVACLQALQLKPYIILPMGSQGGATAKGQARVLTELGITEESVKRRLFRIWMWFHLDVLSQAMKFFLPKMPCSRPYRGHQSRKTAYGVPR
jgi:hypothetical protein